MFGVQHGSCREEDKTSGRREKIRNGPEVFGVGQVSDLFLNPFDEHVRPAVGAREKKTCIAYH